MYNRNLADLDGHVLEMFWMNPAAVEELRRLLRTVFQRIGR